MYFQVKVKIWFLEQHDLYLTLHFDINSSTLIENLFIHYMDIFIPWSDHLDVDAFEIKLHTEFKFTIKNLFNRYFNILLV